MKLYNAYVKPVLLYNSGTWGASDAVLKKLDTFHRRQLRSIVGVKWPNRISNEALYKKTGSCSITEDLVKSRMRLLGHVLRLERDAPAQKAMDFYFKKGTRSRGRPKMMLPTRLDKDLAKVGKRLKNTKNLQELKELAADKKRWKELIKLRSNSN